MWRRSPRKVELTRRIQKALPRSQVLIVSTFNVDGEDSKTILPAYLARSFPEAARETGACYWDMNRWLGPYDPQQLPDGVHVNKEGGKRIAEALFRQLLLLDEKSSKTAAQ